MLFNSYEFLFLFLPVLLACYYILLPGRSRNVLLTVMSYLFYGWWDYRFCSLMLISTLIDFAAGKRVAAAETRRGKKSWVAVSVVSNLSLLGFFKYFDLAASTVNALGGAAGWGADLLPLLNIVLPVGISFYTFQSMSYSIDIYYGAAKPARSFMDFACYVALFPQLIAGPIVRYRQLADQLVYREHSIAKAAAGTSLFLLGLGKKVILADGVAPLVDPVFSGSGMGFLASWTGAMAYTMQIYFDFSGYSDMAVGLGMLFGFNLPQNFNSPYKAVSITDFWRRWHMSLSFWLRDYLYIPLGGNRKGLARTYVNLLLTMLLGGLWHGASWTFVVWGAYHGSLLGLERVFGKRGFAASSPVLVQVLFTFVLTVFGWVFFRAASMEQILNMFRGMLGFNGLSSGLEEVLSQTTNLHLVMLGLTSLLVFASKNTWEISWKPTLVKSVCLLALFIVCVAVIMVNTSSPFLYFQF